MTFCQDVLGRANFPPPHLAQTSLLGPWTTSCYVFLSSPSKHCKQFADFGRLPNECMRVDQKNTMVSTSGEILSRINEIPFGLLDVE